MAFDMQENNKVGFDMTKVKVGDKLVTHNGVVCEVVHIDHFWYYSYELRSCMNPDNCWTVDRFGYLISDELNPEEDIAGFADENQHTSDTSEEMQAVELLLSLGYTLKKGSN